jgi:hypothetical protein
VYEIDLDNRVFHVDAQPLFRLDNLPPDDIFLRAISFDHFGHRTYHESLPEEYRYDWRAPPPTPGANSLKGYMSHCDKLSSVSIHDVLGIPQELSAPERARARLMEVFIIRVLREESLGRTLRVLESVPNRNHIADDVNGLATFLIKSSIFLSITRVHCSKRNDGGFQWFGNNLCLYTTTHLDDPKNLQASIGALIQHIQSAPREPGVIFGIACSMFHCAVISINRSTEHRTLVKHTLALQFLPSFYATASWTPGLEALSRLTHQIAILQLPMYIERQRDTMNIPLESTYRHPQVFPAELWSEICAYLVSPMDLINLAVALPETMFGVINLLQYPSVNGYFLKDAIGSAPSTKFPPYEENDLVVRSPARCPKFPLAKFETSKGGHAIELNVGVLLDYPTWIATPSWSSIGSDDLDCHGIFKWLGLYGWMDGEESGVV